MATPEFEQFSRTFQDAAPAALLAAALHYQGALRPKLQRGYTSGDFTQGIQAAAVQVGEPEPTTDGWHVIVGTNEMVSLYWEFGHQNLFTRRYERVEYWAETAAEEGAAMAAIYGSEIVTRFEAGR